MDINVTLFGEMLTFAVLVWVVAKYIWPPLMQVIQERQEKIALGLEAAARGQHELKLTQENITKQLRQAKLDAAKVLDLANQQANNFLEEVKVSAQLERSKMLVQAKLDLEQEVHKAKEELQKQTVDLVITATEKILQQKVDEVAQGKLIDKLISSI
ncbi:MAG: F0F1 ATP synthase subunit B [Gammaproteobacteria bacterium]|nr:F0F1 ATP synthase subunit B [Gammaproteobacteria bacterium]